MGVAAAGAAGSSGSCGSSGATLGEARRRRDEPQVEVGASDSTVQGNRRKGAAYGCRAPWLDPLTVGRGIAGSVTGLCGFSRGFELLEEEPFNQPHPQRHRPLQPPGLIHLLSLPEKLGSIT